ncbi:hypothetical protein CAP35_02390 [Chitinophagaceae bacterium IBVUCB1]|nr:hypothetical protein CAP35_02390 [Chitinophagaceae bacterium IBVUCB1]
MQSDKTTLKDLSVFAADEQGSIFGLLAHTTTQAGKEVLRRHIQSPPDGYEHLLQMQEVVQFFTRHTDVWPDVITNGTLVMLEKFFDETDGHRAQPSGVELLFGKYIQKYLNKQEYFFTQFSLSHITDLLRGCMQLTSLASLPDVPALLKRELELMAREMVHPLTSVLLNINKDTPYRELAALNYKLRREMKSNIQRLVSHYTRLDAWQAMAKATLLHNWHFPVLLPPATSVLQVQGLYHPLLPQPIPYDIALQQNQNFLLLTGANMSGKTTFMRALGVAALLAHLGMGVPAAAMRISFLQGIVTNMHVEDNLIKGESYFFAEVQRMKLTARQLQQQGAHLVLMDELFKGTNVHDAYECTKAVVEGLLNHPHHLMVLSTHLHEVAQHFSTNSSINFAYFTTQMAGDDQFLFTYQLQKGISNDRIGYRILQKEGVLKLLQGSKENT